MKFNSILTISINLFIILLLSNKTDILWSKPHNPLDCTNETNMRNAIIPDFQVNENSAFSPSPQEDPAISADGSGNYIITWQDGRNGYNGNVSTNSDIYAQQYSSDGTALGSNFKVNDDQGDASQSSPSISADDSGNFIITWTDDRNGNWDIYAQRYSSNGTAMGSNFMVNDDTDSAGQCHTSISADSSGNFAITWRDERCGEEDIYAQRYSSDGNPLDSNFRVTNTSDGVQGSPDVKLWNNRIYNTWQDNRVGDTGYDIWGNVLDWENPIGVIYKELSQKPLAFVLHQNYPNPFNPNTTIEFDLPKMSDVTIKVFNIIGEEVATLVSDRLSAGSYSYEWDASKYASGVYLYRLQAGD
jgi:hypothetical protein